MANITGVNPPVLNDEDYVDKIKNSLDAIDTHDHTTGKGKPIGAAALADDSITEAKLKAVPADAGKFLVRVAVTGAVDSANTVPTGTVVGHTDVQTLTNKVINGANNTLTVRAANDITGQLPIANGGTAASTKAGGFDALSPMTTSGDIIYGAASGTGTRLPKGSDTQVLTLSSGIPSWATPATAPDQSDEISNLTIAASVAASALTIAIKDKAGSDASAGSAVKVGMRSATLSSGLYVQRTITAALSMTVSSGSTLGQTSGQPSTIYVYLIDNAGTLELAVSHTLFREDALVTTTAEGGAGAADSATVIYSTTARTSVALRLVGKIVNTQATAGTWASTATQIQVAPFGISKVPTVQTFAGNGTYNTPAGVTWIRVTAIGGGGGGGCSGTADGTGTTSGGDTIFGSIITASGGAGTNVRGTGASGGATTVNSPALAVIAVSGGGGGSGSGNASSSCTLAGGQGGVNPLGGGGKSGTGGGGGSAATTLTGAGGGGGGTNSTANSTSGPGGGAGGFVQAIVFNPLSTYSVTIGSAGLGGTTPTNGRAGGDGSIGYLIVEEFYT